MNPLTAPWTAVAVEAASAAARRIVDLNASQARGGDTVNDHADASIQADLETEAAILDVLRSRRVTGTFLSEEYLKDGERPQLTPSGGAGMDGGRRVYVVADPLDGSALYAHNLPLWWYACVGIYGEEGEALGACIVDVPRRVLYACDADRAYRAGVDERMMPSGWSELRSRGDRPLSEAWVEIYTMKPKYLFQTAEEYRPLLREIKGIIPNGGPGGFTDCADGLADLYVHYDLPGTEHLSGGLMIAERAGCVVTDFVGARPAFDPGMVDRPRLLCAAGPALHARALELLHSK